MTRVIAEQSISLDGYSTGPNVSSESPMGEGGDERLHHWFDQPDGAVIRKEMLENIGAVVVGRRTFDLGLDPWGDEPPFHAPVFVFTHRAHEPLPRKGGTTYYFVTGGIERALADARAAAGSKDVLILGGADTIQQSIAAGLVDELRLELVYILLGDGTPFFKRGESLDLEATRIVERAGLTSFRFRLR